MDTNRAADVEPAVATDTRRLAIAASVLFVLVASLYLMSQFPDLGAVIERYNQF